MHVVLLVELRFILLTVAQLEEPRIENVTLSTTNRNTQYDQGQKRDLPANFGKVRGLSYYVYRLLETIF